METDAAPAVAEEGPKKSLTPTLDGTCNCACPVRRPASTHSHPPTPNPTTTQQTDLKKNVALLERAVQTTQLRLIGRVQRNNTAFRRALPPHVLAEALRHYLPTEDPLRAQGLEVLAALPYQAPPTEVPAAASTASMEVAAAEEPAATTATSALFGGKKKEAVPAPPLYLPETEVYLLTLVVSTALRLQRLDLASALVMAMVAYVRTYNRRTLDPLAAKVVFYLALTHEKSGKGLSTLRPLLVALHRTACLHHDEIGQATVLNLLLRSLLAENLIEQAGNLVARTNFPEGASNNQLCRYLYYVGRIQATQLDYTDAYTKLNQAARKAPADTALGFRREVTKLLVIVQLLLGDIPERATFDQPDLRKALAPYLALTAAVRHGDLLEFEKVVAANAALFKADKTHTLILRLGHNVIKTGLRKISLSYSRISLADIAAKLHLDGPASAEFVCTKAIRDGVIDALVDHEQGYLQSREVNDVYSTVEPQLAFHKRITFCLDVHNEAVKSMRFPAANSYRDIPAERGEKTEEELAKEIESELEDEF